MVYEKDDLVTFYFIIIKDERHGSRIQAVTDSKDLAEFYMEFHKCKRFKLKKVHDYYRNILETLNECIHDNIELYTIDIKNPNGKPGKESKQLIVPLTESEYRMINEECATFMSSLINYNFINQRVGFLKNKYQRALADIRLKDVLDSTLAKTERPSPFILSISLDQLKILLSCYPDNF